MDAVLVPAVAGPVVRAHRSRRRHRGQRLTGGSRASNGTSRRHSSAEELDARTDFHRGAARATFELSYCYISTSCGCGRRFGSRKNSRCNSNSRSQRTARVHLPSLFRSTRRTHHRCRTTAARVRRPGQNCARIRVPGPTRVRRARGAAKFCDLGA